MAAEYTKTKLNFLQWQQLFFSMKQISVTESWSQLMLKVQVTIFCFVNNYSSHFKILPKKKKKISQEK